MSEPGRQPSKSPVTRAYVAFGSNMGDRLALLQRGVEQIGVLAGAPATAEASTAPHRPTLRASSVYETSPVGGPVRQPAFLNAVVEISTLLDAEELLARLTLIERQAGRVRGVPDGPRSLDLDLLLFGEQIVETPCLLVPHPRLHQRRFVLEPLAELAPDLVHPRLHRTIEHLRAAAQREYPDQRVERTAVALQVRSCVAPS